MRFRLRIVEKTCKKPLHYFLPSMPISLKSTTQHMTRNIIRQTQSVFEQIKRTDAQGNEYWSARDLAKVMEYSEYRHFKSVIEKAKEACTNSGQKVTHHFEDILDMIEIGKGGQREIDNVKLSRYAHSNRR